MSSTYKLNGVDVSGIDYSYTFVTPIFETIEEFQVAGDRNFGRVWEFYRSGD